MTPLREYLNKLPFALEVCREGRMAGNKPWVCGDRIMVPLTTRGWAPRWLDKEAGTLLIFSSEFPDEIYFFKRGDDGHFYPADDDAEVAVQLKAELVLAVLSRNKE